MSKRLFILAALCLALPAAAFAQIAPAPDHGRILGAVVSSSVGPLMAAEVSLRTPADSTVARVATATDGRFLLDDVAFGTYTVRVSFIGYKTRVLEGITVNARAPLADLGVINLDAVLVADSKATEKK